MNKVERIEHMADKLGRFFPFDSDGLHKEVAAELRRLAAINAELVATLIEARHALQMANDSPNGPISDTIWMMHQPETLFDFLDVALEKAKQ